jgi:hypothetical protein
MMRGVANEEKYFSSKRRGDNVADRVVARGVANAVPYGYRRNETNGVKSDPSKDAKALVPHDEHGPIVKRIFALRLEGHRVAAIVRTLNDAGILSPRGKRWTDGTVETILRNEVYTGVVKLGRRRKEGAHEALVSKSDWRKVKATRAVTLSGTYKAGIAGGLLVCSGCGRPLGVAGHAHRLVYACRDGSAESACLQRVHVIKHRADAFVRDTIVAALDGNDIDLFASSRQLDEAREKLAQAKAARDAWLEMADVLTKEELEVAIAPRRAAVEEAQEAYDAALAAAEDEVDLPRDGSAFLVLDEPGQRRVARLLIDRVVVSPPIAGGMVEDRFAVVFTYSR